MNKSIRQQQQSFRYTGESSVFWNRWKNLKSNWRCCIYRSVVKCVSERFCENSFHFTSFTGPRDRDFFFFQMNIDSVLHTKLIHNKVFFACYSIYVERAVEYEMVCCAVHAIHTYCVRSSWRILYGIHEGRREKNRIRKSLKKIS